MNDVKLRFPPGHYYSPVVDPTTLGDYVHQRRADLLDQVPGIFLPKQEMADFWRQNLDGTRRATFKTGPDKVHRYYRNNSFGIGDAIILRAMMATYRPKRIIEIGAGFSTACMLDTASQIGLRDLKITCIEPYPDRLKALLRPEDGVQVEIIGKNVQEIPTIAFGQLNAGDILFIDSTHVMKTGSDVHYELFSILPALKSGVVVHFHDIQYPFEYPDEWITKENFSWNEAYAVRAFLMYNDRFQVLFFCNLFGRLYTDLVGEIFPELAAFPNNFGGSLWIRKL